MLICDYLRYITVVIFTIILCACAQKENLARSSSITISQSDSSMTPAETQPIDHKGDSEGVHALKFQDLAIILPIESSILALEIIPEAWLEIVEEALLLSVLGESISDESWSEDWKLVSMRVSPCSPLGKRANREEIDRLCWPGIRLVFQPIVTRIKIFGIIKDYYADDRAIHALYRFEHSHPALNTILKALQDGQTLEEIDESELARFERARDRSAMHLLNLSKNLRFTNESYELHDERPEYHNSEAASQFEAQLVSTILSENCLPKALHELTAFSLPLGRNPASADLWSFVAFKLENQILKQTSLDILDRNTGETLYRFEGEGDQLSEDVTTSHGDHQLTKALEEMSESQRNQLQSQVITDTDQLEEIGDQINDPYQTLVSHTSCASCHRNNNLNFNFHNLSYFEDQEISIAPRTVADVQRDMTWSTQLIERLNKSEP